MRLLAAALLPTALLLTTTCAAPPPAPSLPPPDTVTPAVLDALCARLRMDAIATGAPLAIVSTTRPLATQQSLAALAYLAVRRAKTHRAGASAAEANRVLPVMTEGASCRWRAVTPAQLERLRDEMVIELSAPAIHPFSPREAGVLARAAVGGEGASWYWISLVPHGGGWAVAGVSVLNL